MKNLKLSLFVLAATLFTAHVAIAQAPAGAPTGATGLCKDGSYTTKTMKFTACTGHKGVKSWYNVKSSAKTTKTAKTQSMPATQPATTTAAAKTSSAHRSGARSSKTAAPGGGPGMVWLNTSSKVYHCYGGADYGTTKAGKYLTEAQAKQAGGHAAGGKSCAGK